jgi:diguanylate cyclase (GGDEF)-like protein/PAS domain S-box-containing protein
VAGLSFGLVLLTCSLVVSVDLLGLLPPAENQLVERRIRLCESLAAQASAAAARSDYGAIRALLELSVEREGDLLSAGLRETGGKLLVVAGPHRKLWDAESAEQSTASHVRVPLHRGQLAWATLEVRFADAPPVGALVRLWSWPLVRILAVVGGLGFFAYLIYLRRTLRHLDPSAVIPTRVQAALDVMAEGVVLIDPRERIVLANAAFATRVGRSASSLLGGSLASLGFERPGDAEDAAEAADWPWTQAIEGSRSAGTSLRLRTLAGEDRALVANASPVLDGWGRPKGAIVTFDDVTELEEKTAKLQEALALLEQSQEEIRQQNDELKVLARRDPLTGVANRRAFVDTYEGPVAGARQQGEHLSCIMADIDHFKRINDTHGHATGDEVIRRVAEALAGEVRSSDAVCRYGGEEFCVMLPGASIETAVRVAERLRLRVQSPGFARVPVTASFGVSSTTFGATRLLDLVNQADEALYASKQSGRNRVTRWDRMGQAEAVTAGT